MWELNVVFFRNRIGYDRGLIIIRSRIIILLDVTKAPSSGCLPLKRIWENWQIRELSYRREWLP